MLLLFLTYFQCFVDMQFNKINIGREGIDMTGIFQQAKNKHQQYKNTFKIQALVLRQHYDHHWN